MLIITLIIQEGGKNLVQNRCEEAATKIVKAVEGKEVGVAVIRVLRNPVGRASKI